MHTPEPEAQQARAAAPDRVPVVRVVVGVSGVILFLTALTLGVQALGVARLQSLVQQAGPFAPLLYIFLKAFTYVFAPLTSGPIQLVSGTLFDNVWLGVLYTLIGETLGGSISFWIARRLGRPVVQRLTGVQSMAQIDHFYQTRMGGWRSLVIARLLLFAVWDFLSYAAGLSTVRYRTYVLVSLLAGAVPTVMFVALGNAVITQPELLLVAYGLVAAGIILPLLLRKPLARLLERGR
ncbi:MAG: VTT domain-containing protein [Anaerolineae bacterium]|nr:VTT domain-containing protein [Anaerolineae bacterium]